MFDPFGNYNPFDDPSMTTECRVYYCPAKGCRSGLCTIDPKGFYDGICAECWQRANRFAVQVSDDVARHHRPLKPMDVWIEEQRRKYPYAEPNTDEYIIYANPEIYGFGTRDDVWASTEEGALKWAKQYVKGFDPDTLRVHRAYTHPERYVVHGSARLPRMNDGEREEYLRDARDREPGGFGRCNRVTECYADRCVRSRAENVVCDHVQGG